MTKRRNTVENPSEWWHWLHYITLIPGIKFVSIKYFWCMKLCGKHGTPVESVQRSKTRSFLKKLQSRRREKPSAWMPTDTCQRHKCYGK